MQVQGIPSRSLVDQKVSARLVGLPEGEEVSVHLNLTNGLNLNYDSFTSYVADGEGNVDLDVVLPSRSLIAAGSAGGTMDLFRTLKAREGFIQRFWSADVTKPYRCRLKVLGGRHVSLDTAEVSEPMATVDFDRLLLSEGVRRVEVREGRLVGTMFLPKQTLERKKPCIITLHGGHNRKSVVEDNAALLCSRLGLPTLALAFFGVGDLPRKLFEQDIDVTYFEEALDFLRGVEGVRADAGVGLWGISKGSEVCLALCSLLGERVRCAVIVNTILKPGMVGFVYGDEVLKPQKFKTEDVMPKILGENLLSIAGIDDDLLAKDDLIMPFHRTAADLLFVAGGDDQLVRSCDHADLAAEVLRENGKDNFEVLKYPGLGHLLDLPFAPVTCESFHMLVPPPVMLDVGGSDLAEHSFAQEDSWNKIINFYTTMLK